MKHIYRVQNSKGESCYTYKYLDAIGKLIGNMDWFEENEQRPFPHYDKGIDRTIFDNEICGFKNTRQALKWFKAKEIKQMRRLGFNLVKVPVQKITAVGESQVLAVK